MNARTMTRLSAEAVRRQRGRTDSGRLAARTEEEIEAGIAADPDSDPEVDWTRAVLVPPMVKAAVSIRLDPDVLDFFRAGGKGYQTRINAVLRAWMLAQRR